MGQALYFTKTVLCQCVSWLTTIVLILITIVSIVEHWFSQWKECGTSSVFHQNCVLSVCFLADRHCINSHHYCFHCGPLVFRVEGMCDKLYISPKLCSVNVFLSADNHSINSQSYCFHCGALVFTMEGMWDKLCISPKLCSVNGCFFADNHIHLIFLRFTIERKWGEGQYFKLLITVRIITEVCVACLTRS